MPLCFDSTKIGNRRTRVSIDPDVGKPFRSCHLTSSTVVISALGSLSSHSLPLTWARTRSNPSLSACGSRRRYAYNGLYTSGRGESFVTPIEVTAMNFGRGMDSGIVQRTFRIPFVVMFGGLIVNPFVSLKEDMSGVAPEGGVECQEDNLQHRLLLTDGEHDIINRPPKICRLLPSPSHIIRNQGISLDELSSAGLDVRLHLFIVIENVRIPQQESRGMTLIYERRRN